MQNLKEEILGAIKNTNKIDETNSYISKLQDNLVTNYSNNVINNTDKNEILKNYSRLENLKTSLYKYKILKENNITDEATKEKKQINNILQQCPISQTQYMWHSEKGENTCKTCTSLDQRVFNIFEQIPEEPHPNCKCSVEIIDNTKTNHTCNCREIIREIVESINNEQKEIKNIMNNINLITNKSKSLIQIIMSLKNKIKNITGLFPSAKDTELETKTYNIIERNENAKAVYLIFEKEKHEMEKLQDGLDKYHHAKANCDAAINFARAKWAIIFSIGKEIKDYYQKVVVDHKDAFKIAQDCFEDLKADFYGLIKAQEEGSCEEKVKDVYDFVYKEK